MGVRMDNLPPPKRKQFSLGEFAREHKLFSGFAGSALIVAVAIISLIIGQGNSGSSVSSTAVPVAETPTEPTEANPDSDEDGVLDAEDECPSESGIEPSGCPDGDGDEVIDSLDRCPSKPAQTGDGCPPSPSITYLSDSIESGEVEYLETDSVAYEQVTVGGVIDPLGIRMEVGGAYRSGAFTIPANRRFQIIRGRVGVSSEPCSSGSIGYVGIRNAEGELLWPKNGHLMAVGRDASPFDVNIAGEDAVVLFAQAPEPKKGYCGVYVSPTTEVGWVHTQLIAVK